MSHLYAIAFWLVISWLGAATVIRAVEFGIEKYVLAMVARTTEA